MMKKLRAITLVELLVAMAVFSIIMVGVMNMIAPVQETATQSKILNYQKTNEETIVQYIGEQLKYANNILIAEYGAQYETDEQAWTDLPKGKHTIEDPADAALAFLTGMGITIQSNDGYDVIKPVCNNNSTWSTSDLSPYSSSNYNVSGTGKASYYHMIIWDGENAYKTDDAIPATYKGRMFSNVYGKDYVLGSLGSSVGMNQHTDFSKYPNELYYIFGKGYFGTSDIYLNFDVDSKGLLTLTCYSEYYKNASKKESSVTNNNPTVGTFQLRNLVNIKDGDLKDNEKLDPGADIATKERNRLKFMKNDSTKKSGATWGEASTPGITTSHTTSSSKKNIVYIVYTTDMDVENIMQQDDDNTAWAYNLLRKTDGKRLATLNCYANSHSGKGAELAQSSDASDMNTDAIKGNYIDGVRKVP